MAFKGVKTPGSLEEYTRLEIEHILPDKPEAELKDSFERDNPDTRYDDYKMRLGNLTMLEKPINIVAGNGYFAAKKPHYEKSGNYLTRSICGLADVGTNTSISRIDAVLRPFNGWSGTSIDDRKDVLRQLAGQVWSIRLIDT